MPGPYKKARITKLISNRKEIKDKPNCLTKNFTQKNTFLKFKTQLFNQNLNVMKKLISLFAMVIFMTGMVVAQSNTATTSQEGNQNDAVQTQKGASNDADINQGVFGTKDPTDPMNRQNKGYAEQFQDGNNNEAVINQRSGSWGKYNYSLQRQIGNQNEAEVTFFNQGNHSEQIQRGNKNWSQAKSSNGKNDIYTTQVGNQNEAKVLLLNSYGSEAIVLQRGHVNFTDVDAKGERNDINVRQIGNNNDVKSRKPDEEGVYVRGNRNDIDIAQDGNQNQAWVQNGRWGNADKSDIDFLQRGNKNYLEARVNSAYNNTVDAKQIGNGNYFRVMGIKGDYNDVKMVTRGHSNFGSWDISSTWPEYSDRNELEITTRGNNNITSGKIEGDKNDVMILQNGNQNMVGTLWHAEDGVHIKGHNNSVDIKQMSHGNQTINSVMGDGNSISVFQK
jgi:hypothetical protein